MSGNGAEWELIRTSPWHELDVVELDTIAPTRNAGLQTTGQAFRVEAVKELPKSRGEQGIGLTHLQGLLKVEEC